MNKNTFFSVNQRILTCDKAHLCKTLPQKSEFYSKYITDL